ncbi:hypothetical protein NM688_g6951 [Phlebia brevispora]|uniref:Uncharacterized protein n=1 Tax=Phlebia brevispora TaxID=194682 RepID=A0ACC1SAJ4_9APHY|nr:hypothetical protein NM688_g6951 [Phlebia brevispora]
MQFLTSIALALAATGALAAPVTSPIMGVINTPTASSTIAANESFDFDYAVTNWCEEGYNHFKVFMTSGSAAPTVDDVDTTGDVESALYSFGEYVVANFGLPAPTNPPPSSLTAPVVSADAISEGASTFLTVVQIFSGCPGSVAQEVGVTSVPFEYSASS